jgi:hypothetical protein
MVVLSVQAEAKNAAEIGKQNLVGNPFVISHHVQIILVFGQNTGLGK